MNRLVQRFWTSIRHRQAKAGRGQHTQTAGQHRRGIRQQIPKQVIRDNHVKLFGPAAQLHRASIGIHMAKLHIRIILIMHFLNHFAP